MVLEDILREKFPFVDWREPILVGLIGETPTRYGCRYCIAMYGLKGWEVRGMPDSKEAFLQHLKEEHGIKL